VRWYSLDAVAPPRGRGLALGPQPSGSEPAFGFLALFLGPYREYSGAEKGLCSPTASSLAADILSALAQAHSQPSGHLWTRLHRASYLRLRRLAASGVHLAPQFDSMWHPGAQSGSLSSWERPNLWQSQTRSPPSWLRYRNAFARFLPCPLARRLRRASRLASPSPLLVHVAPPVAPPWRSVSGLCSVKLRRPSADCAWPSALCWEPVSLCDECQRRSHPDSCQPSYRSPPSRRPVLQGGFPAPLAAR
jgi:hypothetical protein